MTQYTIAPRGRGYWIEAVAEDGSRRPLERYDSEEAAVRRLRMLQEKAGIAPPEQRVPRGWRG